MVRHRSTACRRIDTVLNVACPPRPDPPSGERITAELSDLDLLRLPTYVVAALHDNDVAIVDGAIVRRVGTSLIVEADHEPPWLR